MKTTQARIEVTCPDCDKKSFSNGFSVHYTCNCAWCGALLLVKSGEVSLFNEKTKEEYAAWKKKLALK